MGSHTRTIANAVSLDRLGLLARCWSSYLISARFRSLPGQTRFGLLQTEPSALRVQAQQARYYLQRTSDYMRENLNPGIDDLINEDRIGRSFNPLVVEDSLEEMDRALYATWRAMQATLAETRQLLPLGSMPDLIVRVEDPPVPPAPRVPRY